MDKSIIFKVLKNYVLRREVFKQVYIINRVVHLRLERYYRKWSSISDNAELLLQFGFIERFKQILDQTELKYSNLKWFDHHDINIYRDSSNNDKRGYVPGLDRIIKYLCQNYTSKPLLFTLEQTKELVDLIVYRYGHLNEIYYYLETESSCILETPTSSIQLFTYIFERYMSNKTRDSYIERHINHPLGCWLFKYYLNEYNNNQQLDSLKRKSNQIEDNDDSGTDTLMKIKKIFKSITTTEYFSQEGYDISPWSGDRLTETTKSTIEILDIIRNSKEIVKQFCLFGDFLPFNSWERVPLEIVEYFYNHFGEESICTSTVMNTAVRCGQLDIVKYIHANRTEWSYDQELKMAFRHGYLDIIKYFIDKQVEKEFNQKKLSYITRTYDPQLLEHLAQDGYIQLQQDVLDNIVLFEDPVKSYFNPPDIAIVESKDSRKWRRDILFSRAIESRDFKQLETIYQQNEPDEDGDDLANLLFDIDELYLKLLKSNDLEMIQFLNESCDGAYRTPNFDSETKLIERTCSNLSIPLLEYFMTQVGVGVTSRMIVKSLSSPNLDYLLICFSNDLKKQYPDHQEFTWDFMVVYSILCEFVSFRRWLAILVHQDNISVVNRVTDAFITYSQSYSFNGDDLDWEEQLNQLYSDIFINDDHDYMEETMQYCSTNMANLLLDIPYIPNNIKDTIFENTFANGHNDSSDMISFHHRHINRLLCTQPITNHEYCDDFRMDIVRLIHFNRSETTIVPLPVSYHQVLVDFTSNHKL